MSIASVLESNLCRGQVIRHEPVPGAKGDSSNRDFRQESRISAATITPVVQEFASLKSQIVISSWGGLNRAHCDRHRREDSLRSQFVTSKVDNVVTRQHI